MLSIWEDDSDDRIKEKPVIMWFLMHGYGFRIRILLYGKEKELQLNTKIRDRLFTAIRKGMDIEVPSIELSAEECTEIMQIGEHQSIQLIIYRGFRLMNLSEDCLKQFERSMLKNAYKYIKRNEELKSIIGALDNEGIPYIPLKGAVIKQLYPEPELRTSCDIDILVREKDLDNAVKAVESSTDFKFKLRNYHDIQMRAPGTVLEMHFSIKENMANIDKLLSRAWDNAKPTGLGSGYAFTPEFQVFHVIAHMSYHMVHSGLGIRPFLDLWLLRNKTEFDEEKVRKMCEECGILTFYEKSCQLVDAWMEGRAIPEELASFEEYCLNGGVFGSAESVNASRMRNKQKGEYVLKRLLVSREVLEEEYPALKEKQYLLPVYQVERWMRLLDPKKRSHVLKELEGIRDVKREAVDTFDEMLRGLGL